MVVSKTEYDFAIIEYKQKEWWANFKFLKLLPLFNEMQDYQTDYLNIKMEVWCLKPGEVLYE